MNDKDAKALIEEVRALKMLTVLQLMQQGVKQRQIASILGVSEATVSRMIPKADPKPKKEANSSEGEQNS
jgi:predicted transcriptional regulator